MDQLLTRYWFRVRQGLGFGVTAYSVEDAKHLLIKTAMPVDLDSEVVEIIEAVDIRDLDQKHVTPNMGPPNLRGVWFPFLNL
jgi:hypothetical protein